MSFVCGYVVPVWLRYWCVVVVLQMLDCNSQTAYGNELLRWLAHDDPTVELPSDTFGEDEKWPTEASPLVDTHSCGRQTKWNSIS